MSEPSVARACSGDANIPGGSFTLGAEKSETFVFDNEKWAHPVELNAYRMSRAPVSNDQFAAFVDEAGYARRDLWCDAGWAWREHALAIQPVYWRKVDGVWLERRYDKLESIAPDRPVCHVNWFEAQAYCRWAKRRLPSEAEWEFAASCAPDGATRTRYPWGNVLPDAGRANFHGVVGRTVDVGAFAAGDSASGCRQMLGNVWEWTADTFAPYPGFVRDPYKEYSEPWFGTHKVLRGGSFATRAWLMRNTWRNFYTPDRRDIYAGFRTCA
jgi:iron(II)-dependent oxidoreductase